MSLIKHLLLEANRDVMINKIGIPPKVTDKIQQEFGKKFQLVVASILKNMAEGSYAIETVMNQMIGMYKSDFKKTESYTKENNFPVINFNELKAIDSIPEIRELNLIFRSIKDYRDGAMPIPQLKGMSVSEAYNLAEQWHEQLEATDGRIDIQEGQVVIKKFDDGYYWLDLNTSTCDLEGESMGHCGRTDADTLLSLRDDKGKPHVTVAYDYDGTYYQMKGKQNKKPIQKYHPYIVSLFTEEHSPETEGNETYQIKNYEQEYKPYTDFHITDLEPELFNEVRDSLGADNLIKLIYFKYFEGKKIDNLLNIQGESHQKDEVIRWGTVYLRYSEEIPKIKKDFDKILKLLKSTFVINKYSDEEVVAVDEYYKTTREKLIKDLIPYIFNDDYNIIKYYVGDVAVYTAEKI